MGGDFYQTRIVYKPGAGMCGGGSNDAGGAPQLTEFRMPPVSTTGR